MKVQTTLTILTASLATAYGIRSLERKLDGDNCEDDLKQLEENQELTTSLAESIEAFASQLHSFPKQYCAKSSLSSNPINLDCVVDFQDFTSEYLHICDGVGAKYEPVTVFMECSTESKVLEMELMNMPTCLAQTCDEQSEIRSALNLALKTYSSSSSSEASSCQFFHRTIDIPLTTGTRSNILDKTFNDDDKSGAASQEKTVISFVALIWSVLFLL